MGLYGSGDGGKNCVGDDAVCVCGWTQLEFVGGRLPGTEARSSARGRARPNPTVVNACSLYPQQREEAVSYADFPPTTVCNDKNNRFPLGTKTPRRFLPNSPFPRLRTHNGL